MSWEVDDSRIQSWLDSLDDKTYDLVIAAIEILSEDGPGLGRPLVDKVEASKFHNMKELRPGSSGRSECRILFIFDRQRRAILLFAGDKNNEWSRWYKRAIQEADRLYEEHLEKLI